MSDFDDDDEINDESGGDTLAQLKSDALKGMREYLAGMLDGGGEAGYTSADIGECGRILDAFLATIEEAPQYDEEAVMGAVEFAVRSLNTLNARCHGSLIETDQREQLCELISKAAATRGVGSGANDITEAWREW